MLALAALAYPFGVPVLSEERFVAHMNWLGVTPSTSEKKELAALPQTYADMHGWEELADGTAAAWATLSAEERKTAKLWAVSGGYGPAAALDHFGPARGLPPAIAGHNRYWLWGYGADDRGAAVVLLGGPEDRLRALFDSFERVGTIECGWCMPYENHKPVWVGRGMRKPWAEVWPLVKHYD